MRAAATRRDVLDSVASARRGAGDCMSAMHLSGNTLRYGAAVLGGVLLGRWLLHSRRPKVVAAMPAVAPKSSLWAGLAVQTASVLLLPLLRAYLLGDKKLPSVSLPHVSLPSLPVIDLNRLFYRWLGLEK